MTLNKAKFWCYAALDATNHSEVTMSKQQPVQVPGGVIRLGRKDRPFFRWSWKRQLLETVLPVPFTTRHAEYSVIASTDDDVQPSERLMALALQAIQRAATISMADLDRRVPSDAIDRPSFWPGGHYRLLAAFVDVLKPRCVVEVGTAQGMSALALKHCLPSDGQVVTFDLIPWQEYEGACVTAADFADRRLVQYTENLADAAVAHRHRALLSRAELIFLDAAKDGVTEPQLLANLREIPFVKPPLLLFDDIRVWNMLKVWREIPYPKLDLTSFGHWTGTGVVEWLHAP